MSIIGQLEIRDLKSILKNQRLIDEIYALRDRWIDERDYEDFDEYDAAVVDMFNSVISLNGSDVLRVKKVSKNFKITFAAGGTVVHFTASGKIKIIASKD